MTKKINIIGYSGHSYVCIEVALLNDITIIGYCDLNHKNENPYGLTYLGQEKNMNSKHEVFICIADNIIRKKIYNNLTYLNFNINLIHPNSIISNTVDIGFQSLVCAGAIINSQVALRIIHNARHCLNSSKTYLEYLLMDLIFMFSLGCSFLMGSFKIDFHYISLL